MDYAPEGRPNQSAAESVVPHGTRLGRSGDDVGGIRRRLSIEPEHSAGADRVGGMVEGVDEVRPNLQIPPLTEHRRSLLDGNIPVVDTAHEMVAAPTLSRSAKSRPDPFGVVRCGHVPDDLRIGAGWCGSDANYRTVPAHRLRTAAHVRRSAYVMEGEVARRVRVTIDFPGSLHGDRLPALGDIRAGNGPPVCKAPHERVAATGPGERVEPLEDELLLTEDCGETAAGMSIGLIEKASRVQEADERLMLRV